MLITPALVLLVLNAWLLWHITRAKLDVHPFCILPIWIAVAYEIFTVFPSTLVAWLRGSTLLFAEYGPAVVLDTDALPMLAWSCAFLALTVGYVVAGGASRNQALRLRRFLTAPRVDVPSNRAVVMASLVLAGVLTAAGLYYYQGFPPIVDAFSLDDMSEAAASIREQRKAISKGHYFGEAYRGQGIVLSIMALGFPWLASLAMSNAERRRPYWVFALFATTILAFLFLAGGGIRSRFLEMMVILFIAASAGRRITVPRVAALAAVVFLVAVPLSLVTGKVPLSGSALADSMTSLERVGYRIAFGNGSNNLPVIELRRREVLPAGLGRLHLDKALNAIPGVERAPFAQEIAQIITYRDGQVTTFASMTGLGFGFAEGGIPGAMLLYFAAGAIIGLVERWMFTLRKNALNLATIAVVTLLAGKLSFLNMISFTVNFAVCSAIALSFFVLASLFDWFSMPRVIAPRPRVHA